MFDNYKNSPDSRFLADIHSLAENTTAIAHSLAVIAGILAKREGIPCTDPTLTQPITTPKDVPTTPPSNHSPMMPEDTKPLGNAISAAYDALDDRWQN